MKFEVRRATDRVPPCKGAVCIGKDCFGFDNYYEIEVNTLEDILRLSGISIDGVIISRIPDFRKHDCEWEIMIYDGYIE